MMGDLPLGLIDLLCNAVVLRELMPYLPIQASLSLLSTSKTVRTLLLDSPDAFRYLNLTQVKSATLPAIDPIDRGGNNWRSQRMDEALTEDEFYSGPLRGIFSKLNRQHVLDHVQVLVLDGLSVPAELVQEIISAPRFNVRILSIREVQHLNERQLMHALQYAVRPSRPSGTPRLKGLYVFGQKNSSVPSRAIEIVEGSQSLQQLTGGILSAEGAQVGAQWNQRSQDALNSSLSGIEERVYRPSGRFLKKTPLSSWAETLIACEGIIAFDAVLCRGPRHDITKFAGIKDMASIPSSEAWLPPAVATIALGPKGCESCLSSPEGPGHINNSPPHHLPLVGQAPSHTTSIAAAQMPRLADGSPCPPLYLRCEDCMRARWCEKCSRWWCEDCFTIPAGNSRITEMGVARDCWGCGKTCLSCKLRNIRHCQSCGSEYCIIDDEGCSDKTCAWCTLGGRRTRELY